MSNAAVFEPRAEQAAVARFDPQGLPLSGATALARANGWLATIYSRKVRNVLSLRTTPSECIDRVSATPDHAAIVS